MTPHQLHAQTPGWAKIVVPIILTALLSGLGGLLTLYSRVSALESHHMDDTSKIDHIQSQVDKIYDVLLEWGGKK